MITTPVLNIDEQIKRVACISDIHGNLEALSAVFHDIQDKGIENILCVGDVVGYGADPGPCIDIMRNNNILTFFGIPKVLQKRHLHLLCKTTYRNKNEK